MSGRPSHARGIARYIVSHLRSRAGTVSASGPDGAAPKLEFSGLSARPDQVRKFLAVTFGEEIFEPEVGGPMPPTFPGVWETASVLDLLRLGGYPLPTRGVIHVGSDRVQIRQAGIGEGVRLEVRLGAGAREKRGVRVTIGIALRNRLGQPCYEDRLTFLIPGAEPRPGFSGVDDPPSIQLPGDAEWRTLRSWRLPAGLGRRYALASGDFNPLHLSSLSARALGFDGPILHGCCIEAIVAHALLGGPLVRDPARLRRLSTRFNAPLALPGEARLEVAERESGGWFRVTGDKHERPFAVGEWTGKGASQG